MASTKMPHLVTDIDITGSKISNEKKLKLKYLVTRGLYLKTYYGSNSQFL